MQSLIDDEFWWAEAIMATQLQHLACTHSNSLPTNHFTNQSILCSRIHLSEYGWSSFTYYSVHLFRKQKLWCIFFGSCHWMLNVERRYMIKSIKEHRTYLEAEMSTSANQLSQRPNKIRISNKSRIYSSIVQQIIEVIHQTADRIRCFSAINWFGNVMMSWQCINIWNVQCNCASMIRLSDITLL